MRKLLLLLLFMCLSLCACSKSTIISENQENEIDIDINQMTPTIADSYLAQITEENNYKDYLGKTVRIKGIYDRYKNYHSCIFGSNCCGNALEFILKEGYEYPEKGQIIEVIGKFNTYTEEENGKTKRYFNLIDSEIKIIE